YKFDLRWQTPLRSIPTGVPEVVLETRTYGRRAPLSYTRFRMKKFLYGAAALSLALAFTGCDDEEDPIGGNGDDGCVLDDECNGYICDLSNPDADGNGVCLDTCVIGENECAEGYVCNDAGACELDEIVEVEGYN